MSEIATIKTRILQYLDFKGISKYECYQKTGITNGVLSKKEGLSEDNLLRFVSCFGDISTDWLLMGRGNMLRDESSVSAQEPVVVCKSDPKDAQLIQSKDIIIEDKSKIIAMQEEKIKLLEQQLSLQTTGLGSAQCADTTHGTIKQNIHK